MGFVYANEGYRLRIAGGVVTTPAGSLALAQVVAVRVVRERINVESESRTIVGRFLEKAWWGFLALGSLAWAVTSFKEAGRSLLSLGMGILSLGGVVWFLHLGWGTTPFWAVVADTPAGPRLVARCGSAAAAAEVQHALEAGLRDLAAGSDRAATGSGG